MERSHSGAEAAIDRAVAAFNAGEYHLALDEFEVPYHEGDPARRELYLGLVRASAALHHFTHGHPIAARRLLASARGLLLAWSADPGRAHGLDLAQLVADLDRVFAALADAGPGTAEELRPGFRPELRRVRM